MSYSALKLSNHEVLEFNIFLEPKMALKVLSEQLIFTSFYPIVKRGPTSMGQPARYKDI